MKQYNKDVLAIAKAIQKECTFGGRVLVNLFSEETCKAIYAHLAETELPNYKMVLVTKDDQNADAVATRNSSDCNVLFLYEKSVWPCAQITSVCKDIRFSKALLKRMSIFEKNSICS